MIIIISAFLLNSSSLHWSTLVHQLISDNIVDNNMITHVLQYYQIELGCYIHQLLWTEASRSDALEMVLHHLITICLLVLSYLTNFTRVGASILFIHDLADIFLETAKVLNYTSQAPGHQNNYSFVMFQVISPYAEINYLSAPFAEEVLWRMCFWFVVSTMNRILHHYFWYYYHFYNFYYFTIINDKSKNTITTAR